MTKPQCPSRRYCDLLPVYTVPGQQIEVCRFCGAKRLYRLDPQGRPVDAKAYRAEHIRSFAQPLGATRRAFMEIYGATPVRTETERLRTLDRKERDRVNMLEEGARWLEKGEVSYYL